MIMAFSGTFCYGTVKFELDILACTISRALPLFSQVYGHKLMFQADLLAYQ